MRAQASAPPVPPPSSRSQRDALLPSFGVIESLGRPEHGQEWGWGWTGGSITESHWATTLGCRDTTSLLMTALAVSLTLAVRLHQPIGQTLAQTRILTLGELQLNALP